MGLTRKMMSVSSGGLVDFRSDKERTARYTKQTRDAARDAAKAQRKAARQAPVAPPPVAAPLPPAPLGPEQAMGVLTGYARALPPEVGGEVLGLLARVDELLRRA